MARRRARLPHGLLLAARGERVAALRRRTAREYRRMCEPAAKRRTARAVSSAGVSGGSGKP